MWLVLALLLQGNILWEFDRAIADLEAAGPRSAGRGLLATDGREVLAARVPLARDVHPGQEVVIGGAVPAPDRPGTYRLVLDLVQETIVWFRDRGSVPVEVVVTIR